MISCGPSRPGPAGASGRLAAGPRKLEGRGHVMPRPPEPARRSGVVPLNLTRALRAHSKPRRFLRAPRPQLSWRLRWRALRDSSLRRKRLAELQSPMCTLSQNGHGQLVGASASSVDSLRRSSAKIGTIQKRLAWPLRKDDTRNSRSVSIFLLSSTPARHFCILASTCSRTAQARLANLTANTISKKNKPKPSRLKKPNKLKKPKKKQTSQKNQKKQTNQSFLNHSA